MDARTAARTAVGGGLDRLTHAVTRRAVEAGEGTNDVDLLIADQLRRCEHEFEDPATWIAFLRGSFRAQQHQVVDVRRDDSADPSDERVLRFATLCELLEHGVPAMPTAIARELADATDRLRANREPFVRPKYVADVGHHAAMASSGATQARMLATVVRCLASRRIIEIGTAYGIGTLALARTAGTDVRIATAERSEPQLGLAKRLLADVEQVTVLGAIASDTTDEVTAALGGPCDLLFHDGAHSREAYIEDFAAYEPVLEPGAAVVFDDIDWKDDRFHPDADTYAGWREVVAHHRVRLAVEVDRTWGLLLLR